MGRATFVARLARMEETRTIAVVDTSIAYVEAAADDEHSGMGNGLGLGIGNGVLTINATLEVAERRFGDEPLPISLIQLGQEWTE